jgi:hypothetical protein
MPNGKNTVARISQSNERKIGTANITMNRQNTPETISDNILIFAADVGAARVRYDLRAEGKLEAAILAAHDGTRNWDPARLEGIQVEAERLDRRRRELYQAADRIRNERGETRESRARDSGLSPSGNGYGNATVTGDQRR